MIENIDKIDLLKSLKEKIKKEYNKKNITFIQIGVNDGITNDIATHVIETIDSGIFIEPIKNTYDIMVSNKKNFKNSLFMNVAILPSILGENNKMNLLSYDPLNQGSSFINVNSERIIDQIEVSVISVNNLLNQHKINNLDILFCDAEGIDFLIIDDFLEYIKPEVMFFETCNWWCNEDTEIRSSNGLMVPIPSRKSFKLKLENLDYYVIDYYENNVNKSQDMIAIKLQYL